MWPISPWLDFTRTRRSWPLRRLTSKGVTEGSNSKGLLRRACPKGVWRRTSTTNFILRCRGPASDALRTRPSKKSVRVRTFSHALWSQSPKWSTSSSPREIQPRWNEGGSKGISRGRVQGHLLRAGPWGEFGGGLILRRWVRYWRFHTGYALFNHPPCPSGSLGTGGSACLRAPRSHIQ